MYNGMIHSRLVKLCLSAEKLNINVVGAWCLLVNLHLFTSHSIHRMIDKICQIIPEANTDALHSTIDMQVLVVNINVIVALCIPTRLF